MISPGGRYRVDEAPKADAEKEALEAGVDPESVYDPTTPVKATDDQHGLTVGPNWQRVTDSKHAQHEDSLLLEHRDGFVAEIWQRDDGRWDVEYVDPNGTRRDGSDEFKDSPQAAFEALAPHIKAVRAEARDRAEQEAEQENVEWPEKIGRYRLKEATASPTNAEYVTNFISGKKPIGLKRHDDSHQIRFYDDTRKYHFSVTDESYARKTSAIEAAREYLRERTQLLNEKEKRVVDEHALKPHQIPDHLDTNDEGSNTDEYDELDEPSETSGIGEGRRKTLAAIEAKDQLDDPQSFDSIKEMKNAVREISLAHPDGRVYMAPPERPLDAIEAAYSDLPDEAKDEYLNDHRLYVKIRSARNRFNDWMGKKRREQEIPSSMEAGPSNYPSNKAKKTARYAREGREELDEAIDKITSAARGAKQRALEAVGSSVAEHNEAKREEEREANREAFKKGDLAFYRTTSGGVQLWGVKRVNEKSLRLRRPHDRAGQEKPMSDEVYPDYDETRADLDSDFLEGPVPIDEVVEHEDYPDSKAAIKREIFDPEWAEDNLDLGETTMATDDSDTYDPAEEFQDDRPRQDQLVDESKRASSDTESRVDEGGSEDFVDDRSGVYDPTEDAAEQASLVPEEVEGQADLTGGQATEDPEYLGDVDEEPEGRFDAEEQGRLIEHAKKATIGDSLIRTIGADTQMGMAHNFAEAGFEEPADLLDEDADFQEIEGVGPATEEKIEDALPYIREGVEEAGDNFGGGRDEWADAVEYVRELYGDSYDDRIELSNDLMDHGTEEGLDVPQSVGGEAVTQPLIRYQNVPPEDAWSQIMNSVGQQEADQIRELLVSYAAEQAADEPTEHTGGERTNG